MDEQSGWLLDLYPDESGLKLWLLADDGRRLGLGLDFPVIFYAAGEAALLRQAWRFLQTRGAALERTRRRDLFLGEREVLSACLPNPACLPGVFAALRQQVPALDYYDVDIPASLRFIARTGVHLLGRCRFRRDGERLLSIQPLDSPWDDDPQPLPLRVLTLSPEVDPAIRPPGRLRVRSGGGDYSLPLEPRRAFLISLKADFLRLDPDLILSDYGDAWLFPQMAAWSRECGLDFNPNRDAGREALTRRAETYFAYGQVIHRQAQTHLYGRWHIDRRNALLFGECGLQGVLEQTRVSGLGVQEMARKSPGAGITAMQMLTALRTGVLVPLVKGQAEAGKTLAGLVRADRGGMIYQPIPGLHADVAQVDFSSMYPAIIVGRNISPETLGKPDAPEGLIPQSLRPLLEKRLRLKARLLSMHAQDCRRAALQERLAALKWLLVVCFGYLGYKNARFGRIETHEAVTALSREIMLQAKETAEDLGFSVLHMYVDSLFVQQEGFCRPEDFAPLLEAIQAQTGIGLTLEGVYKWLVFPPSRRERRVPVPNQYFGALQDGSVKVRGLACRRHDTPAWVQETQEAVLACLAQADGPDELGRYLPRAQALVAQARRRLKSGSVPLAELAVTQKLGRAPESYVSPSPAARAARQLQSQGRQVQAGQFMRFVFTRGEPGVRVWELTEGLDPRMLDVGRYVRLLEREVGVVLEGGG